VAQGTELIVVLLVIYIHGTEQLLPPTMIRYMVWSWRDSRPHGVATVASDPSLGLESTTAGNFLGHVPSLMAYNETGPRISRRADRGDRERSFDWDRRPVHKRLGASHMRFPAEAARGVAGDETLTHDLPTADCKTL